MVFTFIGMPGCGKSCMGRSVSGKLKIRLLDSDKLIERRQGMKLQEFIDANGLDEFKRIEEETLLSIYDKPGEHIILATGGSAVYSDKAMRHLKKIGKVIYLYCSYETIEQRLGDFSKRGVVLKPGTTLRDLYNERCPLYQKYADAVIDCDGTAFTKYQQNTIRAIKYFMYKRK